MRAVCAAFAFLVVVFAAGVVPSDSGSRDDTAGTVEPAGIPPIADLPEPWLVPPPDEILTPGRYAPGSCDGRGGSLFDRTIWFAPDDIEAAIDCSKGRCDADDPVGCRDLASLYLRPWQHPGSSGDPALGARYAARGCELGDGTACALWAQALSDASNPAQALSASRRACIANPKNLGECDIAGKGLLQLGEEADAIRLLLRSCRGTLSAPIEAPGVDYAMLDDAGPILRRYQGCKLLSRILAARGDASRAFDYERLHCLHGSLDQLETCLSVAALALATGQPSLARVPLEKGCRLHRKTSRQEALCRRPRD